MNKRIAFILLVLLASSLCAFAADEVKGFITNRTGEIVIVHPRAGNDVTVIVSDSTRMLDKRGLFGISKTVLDNALLIPGLKVKVKGSMDDQGRMAAKEIITDGDDIEAAQRIQAGLHPTAEQVAKNVDTISANRSKLDEHQGLIAMNQQNIAANKQQVQANQQQIQANVQSLDEHTKRFNALTSFDLKDEATVKFAVGSSKLSKEDHETVLKLAERIKGLTGYVIEVVGYADSTGTEESNLQLSQARAQTVATCLIHHGGIEVRHVMIPGAMGEDSPLISNDTHNGRKENRRAVIKVLVNKGLVG
jgi:OOP family OmpA-OmpF porin